MGMEKLKTSDDRKARKPLLERKRRARINESLSELKGIVLRSLNKDSSRYTKMEKADILEMTVKHLKALRETVNSFPQTDSAARYRDGFNQCASEVSRYVMTMDSLDHATRSDILTHLNTTCQSVHMSIPHSPSSPPLSSLLSPRLPTDQAQDDVHYHFHPAVTYPVAPFMTHAHTRQQQTGSDITYLAPQTVYHSHTTQHTTTSPLTTERSTTTTKPTPEPVWRPW